MFAYLMYTFLNCLISESLCLFSLQVSRCEKFGYGVMVTQVAATAPGVAALHSSGNKVLICTNKLLPAATLEA